MNHTTNINETQQQELLTQLQEQNTRYQQRLEKLSLVIAEKDRRITELQNFEYSYKIVNEKAQEIDKTLCVAQDEVKLLEKALDDEKENSKNLERVIQFLRERLEGSQLESKQFQNDHQTALQQTSLLTELLKQNEIEIDAIRVKYLKEQQDKQEAIEESEAIHHQFDQLKNRVIDLQNILSIAQKELEVANQEIGTLNQAKQSLENRWVGNQSNWNMLANEVEAIKKTLLTTVKNSQEVEARYLDVVNEKIASLSKCHHLQQQVERLRDELKIQREIHKDLFCQNISLKDLVSKVKQEIEVRDNVQIIELSCRLDEMIEVEKVDKRQLAILQDNLKDSTSHIESLEQQIRNLEESKLEIEASLKASLQTIEDLESQILSSQHHLAKKVKEVTILAEHLEEQKNIASEFQSLLVESQSQVTVLQSSMDNKVAIEKQFQEQMQESIKSSEAQISKWEKKYFQMYDKWQEVDMNYRELKGLEDKHKQLQSFIGNLTSILGTPMVASSSSSLSSMAIDIPQNHIVEPAKAPATPLFFEEKRTLAAPETHSEAFFNESEKKERALFDNVANPIRYRQTLFD